MNRIWASAAILVLLAVFCAAGIMTTNRITDEMKGALTQALSAAESGENGEAARLSGEASDAWLRSQKILSTYVPHARLEAIDQTLAGLTPLIAHDSLDEFSSECQRGIRQVEFLRELEIPNIENIL